MSSTESKLVELLTTCEWIEHCLQRILDDSFSQKVIQKGRLVKFHSSDHTRQILVVTAHWNRAHESFFYNATNIKTHPAMATRRKEQPFAQPLYLGSSKMSISESSLPVQYANWQEEIILKRKLGDISNNEKQRLREIYTEQRIVIKKFHSKLLNSRLIQAKMSGDRVLERALRASRMKASDTAEPVPIPSQQSKYRTPQLTAHTTTRRARPVTVPSYAIKNKTHPEAGDGGHTQNTPTAHFSRTQAKLRPSTVATTSRTHVVSDNPPMRPSSEKSQAAAKYRVKTAHAMRNPIGHLITHIPKVETVNVQQERRDSCDDNDDKMSTATDCSARSSKINLVLPNDPYAARIKSFCKSIKSLNTNDSKAKTNHADYYADLHQRSDPKETRTSYSRFRSESADSNASYCHKAYVGDLSLKSLTFKSITMPTAPNNSTD